MMSSQTEGRVGTRQDRRKAATRAKIQSAAERLFDERGYAETSIEDISEAADVATRTIYMHFPSKAAIMLAYFDAWIDAFIEQVMLRPLDEPVVETVRAALQAMGESGWVDRVENSGSRVHPLVEHLDSGAPDIAGHILQRWMREIARLTEHAIEHADHPVTSLEPHARAVAVFAAWIAAMSAARGRDFGRPLPAEATGNSLGLDILALITGGRL